jgi:hypothetical protein
MAGNGARGGPWHGGPWRSGRRHGGRRRGHRALIAASFAGQAAIIAVAAAGSAPGTSAAISGPAAPASVIPAPAAPAGPPPAAVPAAVPAPAVPLPPGEIGVTVSAAGQSGDIAFPEPQDPPLLALRPGADAAITIDLVIPPGTQVRGLWLGIAAGQGTGAPGARRVLLASQRTSLSPGRYAYALHWTMPAGTPAGAGSLLVLTARHPGGADDQAPIAQLVAG